MADVAVSIADVIQKVKDGVYAAMHDPRFDSALEITRLELVLLVAASGGITGLFRFIPLLSGSAAIQEEVVQTITIVLDRTPPAVRTQGQYIAENIEQQLQEAIIAIVEGIKQADEEPVAFSLSEASVELKFALTAAGKVSIVVVEEALTHQKSHTLRVWLKRR